VFNAGENNVTQQTVKDCAQMYNFAMQMGQQGGTKAALQLFKSVCELPWDVALSRFTMP
jgi:hypothetical protein